MGQAVVHRVVGRILLYAMLCCSVLVVLKMGIEASRRVRY
jgi:hypothetical protein